MKALALALVLLAASSAQAQKVFRCVDERGKSTYTEKPGKNCKPIRVDPAPGTPPPTPAPAAAGKVPPAATGGEARIPYRPVRQAYPAKPTRQAHCDGLAAEVQRLGESTSPNDRRRVTDYTKELNRSCG